MRQNSVNMRKLFRYLKWIAFVLSAVFMLYSCRSVPAPVPQPQMGSSKVFDVVLFEPYSKIGLIEKNQLSQNNDSLSSLVSQLIKDVCARNCWIPIADTISINNDTILFSYKSLLYHLENAGDRYQVTVPPELNSLIESSGHRFGMILWATGYERTKGNYRSIVAENIVLCVLSGILTFGTTFYYPPIYKGSLRINAAIVDTTNESVVYHNTAFLNDSKPIDYLCVHTIVKKLFSDYYTPDKI